MKKTACGILLSLLLIYMLSQVFVPSVKAIGTIYIRADGSVDPFGVPILITSNSTYTFTDDILVDAVNGMIVERDNIVIDGNGHTLTGSNESNSIGIYLSGRENVTVQNIQITAFYRSIRLLSSFNNSIIGNNITGATYEGIRLFSSFNNSIKGNNMAGNYYGIWLFSSSNNNSISGNNMTANIYDGIRLFSSSNNSISGNNITANTINGIMLYYLSDYNSITENYIANNGLGMRVSGSSDNIITHNNFVDNTQQVYIEDFSHNIWDNGYPSGGNYWNDYLTRYPNATEIDDAGIGNTPYEIDENNTDRYPLVNSYVIPEFSSFFVQPMFMMATLLAIILYKRKREEQNSATSAF